MESSEKITFRNIKIKKEKLSPPPKQTKDADEIMNEIIPTLFGITNNSDENIDEKKSIEPAKSSNEILAELFKVFNAKPPETLLNDNYARSKKDIKKHKKHKKQKKKKSRKRGRSSSDDDDDDDNIENDLIGNNDKSTKKHKKKKKKSKKHSELSEDHDVDNEDDINKINIKTEEQDNYDGGTPPQSQEIQKRNFDKINDSDFTISDLDDNNEVSDKIQKLKDITTKEVKKEKIVIDKSPVRDPGKIVIKSLINTQIFKDAEQKQQKEKDRKERHHRQHKDRKSSKTVKRESDDSLSLSDEETYLKERENYYKQSSSRDGKSSSYRRDDDFYDRKSRYSSSRRDRDRNYRDSSRDKFRGSWRDDHDHRRSRSRSRRRSRSQDLKIDKKRLLEIARKNAITMFKKGSLPGTQTMTQEIKDKVLLKMRYGGKTVEDLTDFCKKLSNGDNLNDISDLSSNEDSDHDRDGNDKAFHHPFVLKDRGPIVMNIKNAIPIPPKSAEQTKAILMQFPVSSGQHHRLNESEWVPVPQTKKTDITTVVVKPPIVIAAPTKPQAPKNVFAKPLPEEQQQPAFVPVSAPGTITDSIITTTSESVPVPIVQTPVSIPQESEITNSIFTIPPPAPPPTPPAFTHETIMEQESETVMSSANDNIFPTNNLSLDVSSIITKRLNAMRRLQDNPMDSEAIKMMYNAQKDMSAWANSKHIPGQFTGSTGVNVLSARELNAGYQPWARKDQLTSTTPVSGGMGMHLLQKMGWKPGEGLGRERNGALQPLLLEVKLDKRGLLADEEDPKRKILIKRKRLNPPPTIAQAQEDFESKHPVSLLGELATKRRWTAPAYELVNDNGPPHSRNFIFKVIVNGIVYQPSISSNTKKQAKATAAKYCLQQMGVLPV